MSRARRWLLLAGLSMFACACGPQAADPKALPSWIADYPGSHPQSAGSTFVFETQDPAEKVLDFYQQHLIQSGLHMDQRGGGDYGGMLVAEDDSHARSVTINIHSEKGMSKVTIAVGEKK